MLAIVCHYSNIALLVHIDDNTSLENNHRDNNPGAAGTSSATNKLSRGALNACPTEA
jgi:hypothetical protein